MSNPIITVEGRRVYIQTRYGDPCVPALKRLGAHWDVQTKRWWITSAKKSQVEQAITNTAGQQNTADAEQSITVVGKARYKGRDYYVRWYGMCKNGEYKARLCSLDGKLDFWVPVAQVHELDVTGDGAVARITKVYQEPRSLESIRQFVAKAKEKEQANETQGEKPDNDCYWGGRDWLVKGCSRCRSLGKMCQSCRHDVYDS